MTHALAGKSVLIVEDEVIIGMLLCSEISRAGGTAIGPVGSVARALEEIDSRSVDAVVLDAKLGSGSGGDLAACLAARRIPYVVVSGYEKANLPEGLRDAPFLSKPVSLPLLVDLLGDLASRRALSPDVAAQPSDRQLMDETETDAGVRLRSGSGPVPSSSSSSSSA